MCRGTSALQASLAQKIRRFPGENGVKTGLQRTEESGRPDALATPNRQTRLSAALIVFNHRLIAAIFTTAPLGMSGAAAMAATQADPALSSPESGDSSRPSV